MQLNDLRPAEGSRKNRKRIGRGNSSGHGTTAGRGTKGQLSRSGGGKGAGFEGGQQPLAMRLPKLPGFTNHNRVEYAPVNVSRLEILYADGETVDAETLKAKGVIKHDYIPVKVLGDGELTKKLTVKVDKVSASAKAKIEAVGGRIEEC
ncbi:LSU ribosomal protein L15P [Olsenella uli DSM 7084]|uniref:Large ribosomal subunit protein uL15 n=1 Tax=Olsenella uli (strain ATCC 49627 / DSM 7084 / CCUG 31166 / CIP 109912 / JCM 12494 / LMG 11480 / NCIMB 702895 / VPI D76D-27C) TaxID=633147 RepID=E1QX36_OLSUV|nr:50S ribosomal protein L15 [Olsenella uli]ADK68689.1 LSU ribosomal protein L15P [Olsenella uli DSM 7084]EUB31210.1 ribosomal protein L15 [Olsenella uli MSTE5]KRO12164.1 50S ribosomal protein L15 [Olsenella uli DSM 7084]MBS6417666.1 50S ribosomal protein L15 [Olsenella uli]